jgi:hypothetical protein
MRRPLLLHLAGLRGAGAFNFLAENPYKWLTLKIGT